MCEQNYRRQDGQEGRSEDQESSHPRPGIQSSRQSKNKDSHPDLQNTENRGKLPIINRMGHAWVLRDCDARLLEN